MDINKEQFPQTYTIGQHNAIVGNIIVKNIPSTVTFVPTSTTKSDLPNLIPNPNPGEFAAKYGIGTSWQWDGSEWQEV